MAKRNRIDLSEFFPPLYARWMAEVLKGPIPSETEATCAKCAMCHKPGLGMGLSAVVYKPTVKCCSYLPLLPNYLVGRVLLEEDPAFAEGKAGMEARIAERVATTPANLAATASYQALMRKNPSFFGRDEQLLCPHFVKEYGGGKCGIWNNRNSVCTTFFCKYTRGMVGAEFWAATKELLKAVEHLLSHWCVLQVGLAPEALRALYPPKAKGREHYVPADPMRADGTLDEPRYRAMWGEWVGREHDFYKACAEKVAGLRWSQVVKLCGPEVALGEHLVQHAYARLLSDELPGALVPADVTRKPAGSGKSDVFSERHSNLDGLEVPNAVLEVLSSFAGRTTEQGVQAAREQGVEISPELLRKLVDFGVLVAAPAA